MNKTVELVKLWGDYETAHSNDGIGEFCRFLLLKEKQAKRKLAFAKSAMPAQPASVLAKMLGRLGRLLNNYAGFAIRQSGLSSFEEFFYLNDIAANDQPKKTEVIFANFSELSSGLLILDRLKKAGLTVEKSDNKDKRMKRLTITKKGTAVLHECYSKLNEINNVIFEDMPEDDMLLCLQLLSPTESRISNKWIQDKRKSFSELL
jgi:predicted transcriptional regulator